MSEKYWHLSPFKKFTQPVIIFLGLTAFYIIFKAYFLPPTENNISYSDSNLSVLGLNIPSNLHFCGEKIPSNDYAIKSDLEKEFFTDRYWKNNSLILFH